MLKTRVGTIAVTATAFPNGEWHWSTEEPDGWPVGQGWESTGWSGVTYGVWHANDVHVAAKELLRRRLDESKVGGQGGTSNDDLLLALDHYRDLTADDRQPDFIPPQVPENGSN